MSTEVTTTSSLDTTATTAASTDTTASVTSTTQTAATKSVFQLILEKWGLTELAE